MIGIDITDIGRIRSLLTDHPRAEERLFTERERRYCRAHTDPMTHFAGTFAAKEAVVKALHLGSIGAWSKRIEVLRDEAGAPSASLIGSSAEHTLALSISHDANVAVAVAVSVDAPTNSG